MEIYDLKNRLEYLDEVALLEYEEWADNKEDNKEERLHRKKQIIKDNFNNHSFCKLILLDKDILVGFISIFPYDGEETLTPWYSTMYVKKEYRNKSYSKILNDAILEEAKKRNFNKIYLKTNLENYYEKFGAKYIRK